MVALGGHGSPSLRWDYLFRLHRQKPRSLRKLAMTNKRVVIAIGAQRREAISGGNMRSRRKLAMTNFVFFASFVVQNRVNRRIDASSAGRLICRSSVGATTEGCPGRTWKSIPTVYRCQPRSTQRPFTTHHSPFTTHHSPKNREHLCDPTQPSEWFIIKLMS